MQIIVRSLVVIRMTKNHGFTLVELLLSIAILGILAAVVGPVLGTGIRSYALTVNRKVALNSARLAVERITTETRLIATQNDIDTFTSSVFQFDLSTESNINYSLSGGSLQRSGVTLANNATALTFTYLDANGISTATKANIQRIQIELSINAGTGYGSITVRNQVFPRKFFSRYAGFQ